MLSQFWSLNIINLALFFLGKREHVTIWVRFVVKVKLSTVSSPFLRQTLAKGLGDPITGLYATNASAPLQTEAGIRQLYKWGLYSYCGYLNNTAGTCTNTTIANKYQPYDALLADMSLNYSALTIFIINGTSAFEGQLMATHTHSAYYLILIGTICAFLALVMCAAFSFLFGPTANNCASQWRCQAYNSFFYIFMSCNCRNCVSFDSCLHLDICYQQFRVCECSYSKHDEHPSRDQGLERLWLVSLMGSRRLFNRFSYPILAQVWYLLCIQEAT
jgi:hypothetical protein